MTTYTLNETDQAALAVLRNSSVNILEAALLQKRRWWPEESGFALPKLQREDHWSPAAHALCERGAKQENREVLEAMI